MNSRSLKGKEDRTQQKERRGARNLKGRGLINSEQMLKFEGRVLK